MNNIKIAIEIILLLIAPLSVVSQKTTKPWLANPIELNYRFQPDGESRREAADPTCVYFHDAYYLFASKSGGYWRSTDLADWEYIATKTITTIEDYAPCVFVYGDALYVLTSGGGSKLFRNATPEADTWQAVDYHFEYQPDDPSVLVDDDGRVFFYFGCHDKEPIRGVEVDPRNGFRAIGKPVVLIPHNSREHGWEMGGPNNSSGKDGWNEGSAILKIDGKYYLQYAAPGTEVRVYADGYYVADTPLGPFTYCQDSPFSLKAGGFIGGAGHGDTFRDRYGNLWHVSTMTIAQRHMFERRIGLFPASVAPDGTLRAYTAFTDYPFQIPQKKIDFAKWMSKPSMNLLSYRVKATASSSKEGHAPSLATDEQVETWWSAATGRSGEWLQADLGSLKKIEALQVNFADEGSDVHAPHAPFVYQYRIDVSKDGRQWLTVVDATANTLDLAHRLHQLDRAVKARYVRIENTASVSSGQFSVYDLRVFGRGNGPKVQRVTGVKVSRDEQDPRSVSLTWDAQPQATGYIVSWGTAPDRMTHEAMVMGDNHWECNGLNRDAPYYFRVRAFGERGLGSDSEVLQ